MILIVKFLKMVPHLVFHNVPIVRVCSIRKVLIFLVSERTYFFEYRFFAVKKYSVRVLKLKKGKISQKNGTQFPREFSLL